MIHLRRWLVLATHELNILRRDPSVPLLLLVVPLLGTLIFRRTFDRVLLTLGHASSNGSEQAIPGMAVTFGFFVVGMVGMSFFREHGIGTWDRLRLSSATTVDILIGRLLPYWLLSLAQLGLLLVVGVVVFGMEVEGSWVGIGLVTVAFSLSLVAFGMAGTALLHSSQQANALSTFGSITFSGLAGGLVPLATLPAALRAIAPVSPSYWSMRGYRSLILDGTGIGGAVLPVVVLLSFVAGFSFLALLRFQVSAPKTSSWSA